MKGKARAGARPVVGALLRRVRRGTRAGAGQPTTPAARIVEPRGDDDHERAERSRDLLRAGDLDAVGTLWGAWAAPDATSPPIVRREWIRAAVRLGEDAAAIDAALRWYHARAEFDAPTLVHATTAAKRLHNEMALVTFNRFLEDVDPDNVNVILNGSVLSEWALVDDDAQDRGAVRAKRLALRCLRLASKRLDRSSLASLLARIEVVPTDAPADRLALIDLVAISSELEGLGGSVQLADGIRNLRAALARAGVAIAPAEALLNPLRHAIPHESDDLLGASLASAIGELHLGSFDANAGGNPRHPLLIPDVCLAFQADVAGALRPWRSSEVYASFRAAEQERRDARADAAASRASGIRANVLVVSGNWSFTSPLVEALDRADWCDVRTLDLRLLASTWPSPTMRSFNPPRPDESIAAWTDVLDASGWAPLIHNADLCVVDWCSEEAVQLSKVLPLHARFVVRLHSYEAFTAMPYFMNWGGVDGMLFVSEPIRRFFYEQHHERLEGIRSAVTSNAMAREWSSAERGQSDGRTLAMLKYADSNKDPIEALRILSALRSFDSAWSLRLAGEPWAPDDALPAREVEYKRAFFDFIATHDLDDAVHHDGYQDDPIAWLRNADFILSCSMREGTHEALLDGVAAGCTPIIRDWPMLARYGGPRLLYPELSPWVYGTTQEAVDLVQSARSLDPTTARYLVDVGGAGITEFLRTFAGPLPQGINTTFPA